MSNYAQDPNKMMTIIDFCMKQNKGMGDLDKGRSEGWMGGETLLVEGSEESVEYRQLI